MAITIRSIPTLKGKDAEKFEAKATKAISERATINFSKHVKSCNSILSKAKI